MPMWAKAIVSRSVWIYAIAAFILFKSIDFNQAFQERGKYLLGIFYNDYLKNYRDGIVYFDYMRRHEPQNADHYLKLGYCYDALGQKETAQQYYKKALQINPQINIGGQ